MGTQDSDKTMYGIVVTAPKGKKYRVDTSILNGKIIGNIFENKDLM